MAEARLSTRIIRALNAMEGVKAIKLPGSPMLQRGTPDIHATVQGRSVWLETKTGQGRATRLQEVRLGQWQDAGATVAIVRSVDEAVGVITAEMERDGRGTGSGPEVSVS